MKYLFVLSTLSLYFTTAAFAGADGPCASFAKYGAMRAYKMDPRRTEGSPRYDLNHLRTKNEKSLYHVSVNEGTPTEVGYYVTVEADQSTCKILNVTSTSVAEFN